MPDMIVGHKTSVADHAVPLDMNGNNFDVLHLCICMIASRSWQVLLIDRSPD